MSTDIDIAQIAEALNDKADIGLGNTVDHLTISAKAYFAGIGMPSTKYIDLSLGTSGDEYIAPAGGYIGAFFQNATFCNLHNTSIAGINSVDYGSETKDRYATIIIKKDQKYRFYYDGTCVYFRFIYAEGEK